jgi:hypothetical protein
MLFRNAIPLRSVSPYSLNVGLKALTKPLSAVIASGLVVNKGMMHCDVGSSRLELSTVFYPEHTSASIQYDSLVPAR